MLMILYLKNFVRTRIHLHLIRYLMLRGKIFCPISHRQRNKAKSAKFISLSSFESWLLLTCQLAGVLGYQYDVDLKKEFVIRASDKFLPAMMSSKTSRIIFRIQWTWIPQAISDPWTYLSCWFSEIWTVEEKRSLK